MDDDAERNGQQRRGQLQVVNRAGARSRFLRGMITHDLVKRGFDFDDAYAMAQAVRDRFSGKASVTTAQLRAVLDEATVERFGEQPIEPARATTREHPLTVVSKGQPLHFSRGILAESIHASGVGYDAAYRLATEVEAALRAEDITRLSSGDLARRVDELLESGVSSAATRRYRMLRRLDRLPRPVIVYLGGASGTGKSSLAVAIAPLLEIYRVIATDTIRQVMRMIFTPSILPSLHRSSFESDVGVHQLWGPESGTSTAAEQLYADFEEQARRVTVGVRAVVERAIAENMDVIVEGVHLMPGVVPFPDLEGRAYQVPLMLGTLDEELHRSRILTRMPGGERRADRYLGSFESIRAINDRLLSAADAHDVPLLDVFRDPDPELSAVQLILASLERRLPALAGSDWVTTQRGLPTLLLIIDGLADRPVRALGGRTPLQAADTPNLDRLAREGAVGLADPVAPGVVPDTAAGTLALFGQSPRALKRGPVEALGALFDLQPGDVALRGNLATVDDKGNVIDRRAGRIRTEADELAQLLDGLIRGGDIEVRVKAATEHRLAIVLRGAGLSSAIRGSDPGDAATPGPALKPRAIDPENEDAVRTAAALGAFEAAAAKALASHDINRKRLERGAPAANAVLSRGAGRIHRLVSLEEAGMPLRISCITGDRTILGLARWLGADTVITPAMTANLDTDLTAKFDAAIENLNQYDLTIVHVKGADIAGHDRRPDLKVEFLNRLDVELGRLLAHFEGAPLRIAVGSDHSTLSESGQHAADALPVLLWGEGVESDAVERFDEQSVAVGSLGRFPLQMLLGRLFDLS